MSGMLGKDAVNARAVFDVVLCETVTVNQYNVTIFEPTIRRSYRESLVGMR